MVTHSKCLKISLVPLSVLYFTFLTSGHLLNPQAVHAKAPIVQKHFSPQLDQIDAADAWSSWGDGNKGIVVAEVDTGVDSKCILLAGNLTYGYDFVNNRPNPEDDHGHGTHIAGIIGAKPDTVNHISGVTHQVSIMPVKYFSPSRSGTENLMNTIRAFNYAIDHGARIINYSAGGTASSEMERQAIERAGKKGILVVAAAGNERSNIDEDQNAYFPAAYHLPNMITVASTDLNDDLLPSSNWGKKLVDVAAPGKDILSTLPGQQIGLLTGTSQATGFVSGMAALLLSKNPHLTPQQLKKIILATVDPVDQLKGRVASGGRVNIYKALQQLQDHRIQSKISFTYEKSKETGVIACSKGLALENPPLGDFL